MNFWWTQNPANPTIAAGPRINTPHGDRDMSQAQLRPRRLSEFSSVVRLQGSRWRLESSANGQACAVQSTPKAGFVTGCSALTRTISSVSISNLLAARLRS
jgi:hypothetical protein